MTRILFIWPPKLEYVISIQKHYTYFGETIAYLERYPEFQIDVMDGSALLYFQWDFIEAYSREYDFLIVYTDLHNSISAIRAANTCKSISPKTIVISYGEGTPYAPEIYIEQGFDAAIIDPMFERSILNFILYKTGKLTSDNLKGIFFKNSDKVLKITETFKHDISDIAFPALGKIPVEQYKKISGRDQLCFTVARGCPFSCRFCRVPVANNETESRRRISDIIEYLRLVKDDFASIKLIAPTFTADQDWVLHLCKEICGNNLKFKWIVTTRLELLDEQLVTNMSKSGCVCIAFGLETLYVQTQRNVDKFIPRDFLINQVDLIHKHNIIPKAFVMLGIPEQSKEEIEEMYSFLKMHEVEIRPKEYYPYELFFTGRDKLELFKLFERDDVYKTAISGVNKLQFVKYMLDRTKIR